MNYNPHLHYSQQLSLPSDVEKCFYPNLDFNYQLKSVTESLAYSTQASPELIGGVVLSAISLACQAFIQVKYPDGRIRPCSLYHMVIAGSGERKSTVYTLIMQPFIDYEKQAAKMHNEGLAKYKALELIWTREKKNIVRRLDDKIKNNENYQFEQNELASHILKKPVLPKKFKLIYADTTPEALQKGLYDNLPFAGLMSDEANVFFSGRAKNNLGFLNQLWDGGLFDVERRSTESFTVDGMFSMLLMIQPDLFKQYFKRHGKIASGSGFLSRFLISSVETRQGNRQPFSQHDLKSLDDFHEKITFFLTRLSTLADQPKNRVQLTLTPAAEACYWHFQQEVEQLISLHKADSITAFLSKASENAVRLAALISYFYDHETQEITDSALLQALSIIRYHINQTITLFTETLNTPEQDAEFIYEWLTSKQTLIPFQRGSSINKVDVQQYISRKHLRNKKALDAAISILVDQGKIRVVHKKNENGSTSTHIAHPDCYW